MRRSGFHADYTAEMIRGQLDANELSVQDLVDYAADMGFADGVEIGRERGILPVITGGNFKAYRASIEIPGVAMAGARGGFSHPLTSYTMPIAVENALAIASHAHLSGPLLAHFVRGRANEHWRKTAIYRALGRMLFKATEPERRVNIFQRFYQLPEELIERFYACHTTLPDQVRILSGKPPVSIPRAIRALASKGKLASSVLVLAAWHWQSACNLPASQPLSSKRATSRAAGPISGRRTGSPSMAARQSLPTLPA